MNRDEDIGIDSFFVADGYSKDFLPEIFCSQGINRTETQLPASLGIGFASYRERPLKTELCTHYFSRITLCTL